MLAIRRRLQSLRLNCLLAVFLPILLSALCCIGLGHWHRHQHSDAAMQNALLMMRSYVAGLGHSSRQLEAYEALAALRNLVHHWDGLAQLSLHGDGSITELHRLGALEIDYDFIPPQLTWAVASPQAWHLGGNRVAVATPWLNRNGTTNSVLYGEAFYVVSDSLWWYYLVAGGILLVGGALGLYLIRRVYLPVKALTEQAKAAVDGQVYPVLHGSVETQELSAAISQLSSAIPASDNQPNDEQ